MKKNGPLILFCAIIVLFIALTYFNIIPVNFTEEPHYIKEEIKVIKPIDEIKDAPIAISNKAPVELASPDNNNEASIFNLTNSYRASLGLSQLKYDNQLASAAQAKANDLCEKGYWSHDAPDGTKWYSFIINAGYDYSSAGENLAKGFSTINGVMVGWQNSPTHNANLIGSFNDIGVGFNACGGINYYAQEFGSR